jgi:hypothetical protein
MLPKSVEHFIDIFSVQITLAILVNSTEQDMFGWEWNAAQRQGAFDFFYIFYVQIVGEMMLNSTKHNIMLGCEWNAA